MKFLSWMQGKLQRKVQFQNKASHSFPSTQQLEETSPSLPLGLLAIGTFGNNELRVKTHVENAVVDDQSLAKEIEDCSLEEVPKLEEELREILHQNSQLGEEEIDDFDNETEEGVKKKIGLVIGEWKGDEENISHKSIVKRSVSFLVKKMFVCGSGFAPLPPSPSPNFMDAPHDATMKKILRMIVHKKIYPKNSSQMASLKRFIKEKEMRDKRNEDHKEKNRDNCNTNPGSKPIQHEAKMHSIPADLRRSLPEFIFLTTSPGAYLDRKVLVMLLDRRILIGTMRSFDEHGSIVLHNACERIIVGDLYCDSPMGLLLLRAENVILIGELDSRLPELSPHMTSVSLPETLTARKAEKQSYALKRNLKKWMEEFLDDFDSL